MAEVKNDFLKSRMNKDLDDRLVPVKESIDMLKIYLLLSLKVMMLGLLENIVGNNLISSFSTLPTRYL